MTQPAQKRLRSAYTNIALLTVFAGATLVVVGLIAGRIRGDVFNYILGLLLFAALTTAFMVSRVQRGTTGLLFEAPVFLSLLAFVQLGLAPLAIFLEPWNLSEFVTEDGLVRALFLCIAGMMAFWGGTMVFGRRVQRQSASEILGAGSSAGGDRLTIIACVLFAIGCAARAFLLREQMYGFVALTDRVQANLGLVSTLGFVSKASTAGLLVMAIEKYSRRSRQTDFLFWPMLVIQCGWGLISGMKGESLGNFVMVAAVSTICTARFSWKWLATPVLLLVVLYPLNNAYRQLVKQEGRQVSDFESAAQVGNSAVNAHSGRDARDFLRTGIEDGLSRLDALTSVTQLMAIGPMKSMLEGDERLWMIPIYPFIPRLIWKEKPTLYKGQRFTMLLGGDPTSSTAVTYPGDCYIMGGWLGVVFGMFMWGVLAEALVQFLYRKPSKTRIFIYVMMAFSFTAPPIEATVFGLWTSVLQQVVIFGAIALAIYGYGRQVRVRRDRMVTVTRSGPVELVQIAGRQQ